MRAFRHIIFWLIIVAMFCVFGFIHHGQPSSGWDPSDKYIMECALFGILSWGGLGAGIATCGVVAWLLIPRVQRQRLTKPAAICIFLATCVMSILIPVVVMMLPDLFRAEVRPFRGDSGLMVFAISFYMLVVAVLAAVTFVLSVVFIKKFET